MSRDDTAPLPPGRYLDLPRLSAWTSLSVRTLRRAIADPARPLPAVKVRGKLLVRVDDFEAWVAAGPRVAKADVVRIVEEVVAAVSRKHG
jgi:hypothetical protein